MSRLYVGNLNANISKQKLADTFNKYGPLLEIWYNADTCYAFIEYEEPDDARQAIRQLDKQCLCGQVLRVELTKYKKNKNFDGRGRGGGRGGDGRSGSGRGGGGMFPQRNRFDSDPYDAPLYPPSDIRERPYHGMSPPRRLLPDYSSARRPYSPSPPRNYQPPTRYPYPSPPPQNRYQQTDYRSPLRGRSPPRERSPPFRYPPPRGRTPPRDLSPPHRVYQPAYGRSPPPRGPAYERSPPSRGPTRAYERSPPPRGPAYERSPLPRGPAYERSPPRGPAYERSPPPRGPAYERSPPQHGPSPPREGIDLSKPLDIGRTKSPEPVFDLSKPLTISSSRPAPAPVQPMRSAPMRSAPMRSAPMRSAPMRSAPMRSAPMRSAPSYETNAPPSYFRDSGPPASRPRSRSPIKTRYTDYREDPRRMRRVMRSPTPPPVFRTRSPPTRYNDYREDRFQRRGQPSYNDNRFSDRRRN